MVLLLALAVVAVLLLSKSEDALKNVTTLVFLIFIGGIVLTATLLLIGKFRDSFTWY